MDNMGVDRGYRLIEQCVALEASLGLESGKLTARFPMGKILYEQATSIEEWRSLVDALDQIAPGSSPLRWFIAGGFVAHQLGRTNYHSDIDIYLCSTHQSGGDVPSEAAGWAIRRGYDQHSDFVVYNKPDCIFQIILIEDDDKLPVVDLASFILYSFDMQICQCAVMPDGEYLVVDGCMRSAPSKSSRVRKYEDRIAKHDLKCNAICSKHWKSVY